MPHSIAKVTYGEIFWALLKTVPLIVAAGVLYKSFVRSYFGLDPYLAGFGDLLLMLVLVSIARWGVGGILARLRQEKKSTK